MALVAPLLLFLLAVFVTPIAGVLFRSVEDTQLSTVMPRSAAIAREWDGSEPIPDGLVRALVSEMATAHEAKTLPLVAKRLNSSIAGYRSLLLATARELATLDERDLLGGLVKIDPRWKERRYWSAIKQAAGPLTAQYLLATIDRELDPDGAIVAAPKQNAVYLTLLQRTLWISGSVTLICLILGYPIAYLLATTPPRYSNLLLVLLLIPFWTSLLVRTTAWMVLLQNEGLINDLGILLGLWDKPLALIRNRIGVYIAMTHVLLPFMVLPIYSVMRGISPTYMRAASSLGASPVRSFFRVYVPLTVPGVGAGVLLVFIMALGYYVTPALVGAPDDQMLSYFIAFYANTAVNWGMAAALGLMLMACVAIFFSIYQRFVGIDKLRLS